MEIMMKKKLKRREKLKKLEKTEKLDNKNEQDKIKMKKLKVIDQRKRRR